MGGFRLVWAEGHRSMTVSYTHLHFALYYYSGEVMVLTYLEKLRGLREDRDLTQKEVANMLGIAQTTYSQYELGKRAMPIECLVAL